MTTIPDDLRAKAQTIMGRYHDGEPLHDLIAEALMQERAEENARWKASDEAGRESGLMLGPADVAEAVLAERERCALVTETLIEQRRGLSLSFDMIAAAIRSKDPA